MMPQLHRFILHPLTGKVFLCLLAGAYLIYLVAMGRVLSASLSAPSESISEHVVGTNAAVAIKYWTVANMRHATDADLLTSQDSNLTQARARQPSNRGSPRAMRAFLIPSRPSGNSF
jgi:hypothetical protein